jgi:hypothetical protein
MKLLGAAPSNTLDAATKAYTDTKDKKLVPTASKTGSYSAVDGDLVMVDATSGPITITAPAAASGVEFGVKKTDSSANIVTVQRAGTDTIGATAATSVQLKLQDQAINFQANGTNWVISENNLGLSNLDARYLNASTATAKGDIYVASASGVVGRKAVGATNNDELVVDSSTSDGLRYDSSRAGAPAGWAKDVFGYKLTNTLVRDTSTAALSVNVRTIQFLIGKGVSGDVLSTLYMYMTVAMTGGTATAALYESATLNGTSWSRIGSNFTMNLSAAGTCTGSPSGSLSGNNWVRAMLVLTGTAPSVYPTIGCSIILKATAVGGHNICGFLNSSAAPGATLDPSSGWTQLTATPWAAVA